MMLTRVGRSLKSIQLIALLLLFTVVNTKSSLSEVIVSPERNEAFIVGEINSAAAEEFVELMKRHPSTNTLYLSSPGGAVYPSLVIAQTVNELGISTVVPLDAICASACSTIYFAGINRRALGQLGVHRIYSKSHSDELEESFKLAYALTIDAFIEFNVHSYVLLKMLQTPPNSIYFFLMLKRKYTRLMRFLEISDLGQIVLVKICFLHMLSVS